MHTGQQEIGRVKEVIVNNALVVGSILSIAAYVVSLTSSESFAYSFAYYTDLLAVLSFTILAAFRHRINLRVKSVVVMLGLGLLVVSGCLDVGIYSHSKMLLIIIPLFAIMEYNYRKTLYVLVISLAMFLGIGILHYVEFISVDEQKILLSRSLAPWIINVLLITVISLIILFIFKQFTSTFWSLTRDLSRTNEELGQSVQSYREIFNSSLDAILLLDLKGNILDVNEAMLGMYGYQMEEVNNVRINHLSSNKEPYNVDEAYLFLDDAIREGSRMFDWHSKKKNGDLFWVQVALKKTHILGDERVLAVIRDIDEKKKIELQLVSYQHKLEELVVERTSELETANEELLSTNEKLFLQREELQNTLKKLERTQNQLLHSEKMASLGILAAGVAHEINNPLNFIRGGVLGLKNQLENEQKRSKQNEELLDIIDEGVDRAAAIVMSLNHFSRQGDSTMEACQVHDILDNCLVILRSKLKNKIEIIKNYCVINPVVIGNDGKLHQAFLNILTNAVDAIETSGRINIETDIQKDQLVVNIIDNGIGIEKAHISKLTEPFYTTKEPGKGTGLGLSITYNIIQELQGTLEIKSTQNKGTWVIVTLPIETK
jgi:PAS domain S-box-containing protein